MFQAYLDESLGGDWFVLGGCIATAEKWAEFSDEWRRLLEYKSQHYRALDAFRMAEMKSERDRERIPWFYRVITKHAHALIALLIYLPALNKVFKEFSWPPGADYRYLQNPYYIAFDTVLKGIPKIQVRANIDTPIDFHFDEGGADKIKCLMAWEIIRRTVPDETLLMGQPPVFHDDKQYLPVQGADLIAGLARQRAVKLTGSEAAEFPPWHDEVEMPIFSAVLGEEELRVRYRAVFDALTYRLAAKST